MGQRGGREQVVVERRMDFGLEASGCPGGVGWGVSRGDSFCYSLVLEISLICSRAATRYPRTLRF